MSKFVVAVFPTESKAYEGTRVIKNLQAEGSLALFGSPLSTLAWSRLAARCCARGGPISKTSRSNKK
jgi:hypothetical protein